MDFWSRDVENSFDEMFDLNHDGRLDIGEQAYEQDFLIRQTEIDDEEDKNDEEDELDWDELELMDEDERREALEDAGYDPDDFDDEF